MLPEAENDFMRVRNSDQARYLERSEKNTNRSIIKLFKRLKYVNNRELVKSSI